MQLIYYIKIQLMMLEFKQEFKYAPFIIILSICVCVMIYYIITGIEEHLPGTWNTALWFLCCLSLHMVPNFSKLKMNSCFDLQNFYGPPFSRNHCFIFNINIILNIIFHIFHDIHHIFCEFSLYVRHTDSFFTHRLSVQEKTNIT